MTSGLPESSGGNEDGTVAVAAPGPNAGPSAHAVPAPPEYLSRTKLM